MSFVRDAWYVAAWSHEVGRDLLARTICGERVVLFRDEAGRPVALADRCAHRQYPLSRGRLIGDRLQCGYHGVEYDCSGSCVKVPGQDRAPGRMRVHAYPLVEQSRWIWIWIGDPERATGISPPDNHYLDDPSWASVTHTFHLDARAQLVNENLLDLSHESFLHLSTIGNAAVAETRAETSVDGELVVTSRMMEGIDPPPLFAKVTGLRPPIDRWHVCEYWFPAYHLLKVGVKPSGASDDGAYLVRNLNGITPETETSSFYFYAFCRNFALEDRELDELLSKSTYALVEEDRVALEAQEPMVASGREEWEVAVRADSSVVAARRLLATRLT